MTNEETGAQPAEAGVPAPAPAAPAPLPSAADLVPMVDPEDGRVVSVRKTEIRNALLYGYKPPTPEQLAKYDAQTDAMGPLQGLAAAGEGALGVLTFGAGVPALHELSITTPEASAARREEHPISRFLGQAAGIVAPLVLSGGTSAAGEGAAGAAAGAAEAAAPSSVQGATELFAPSIIARLGRGTYGAVAGEAPGLLARTGAGLAAGAVEGGLYSASDVVEKALLGDKNLTTEAAIAEIGLGALFGGGIGAAAEPAAIGLGKLLTKSSSGLSSVAQRIASGDKATADLMFKSKDVLVDLERAAPGITSHLKDATPDAARFIIDNGPKIAKIERDGYPGLARALAGADRETAGDILDNWQKLLRDPQQRAVDAEALLEGAQNTYSKTEAALKPFGREIRPAEEEALLIGPHTVEVPGGGSALEFVPQKAAIDEAFRVHKKISQAINEMRAEPTLHDAAFVDTASKFMRGFTQTLESNPSTVGIFQRLRLLRQEFDGAIPWKRVDASQPALRNAINKFKEIRSEIGDSITGKLWGEASVRQKALDVAYHDYFSARDQFMGRLGERVAGISGVSPAKVSAWVNSMADMRGRAKSDAFMDYAAASKRLATEFEKSGFSGAAEIRKHIDDAIATGADIRDRARLGQIVDSLLKQSSRARAAGAPSGPETLLEAAKHLPLGVGSLIRFGHAVTRKVRDPALTIGVLSTMDKLAKKTSKKLVEAARGIFRPAASAGASKAAQNFAEGGMVKPEDFPSVATNIRNLGSNLDKFSQQVSGETALLSDHAPGAAATAHALAARAIVHLGSKLPDGGQRQPLDAPFAPSRAELASYNRHHEVAQRGPVAVLEHVAGGTLHPDHLEASQTIYPRLHEEVRRLVTDHLADHVTAGGSVPRRVRQGLGLLLGGSMDHSATPQSVLSSQALFADNTAQHGAPPGSPGKPARNVEIKESERIATGSQGNSFRMRSGG